MASNPHREVVEDSEWHGHDWEKGPQRVDPSYRNESEWSGHDWEKQPQNGDPSHQNESEWHGHNWEKGPHHVNPSHQSESEWVGHSWEKGPDPVGYVDPPSPHQEIVIQRHDPPVVQIPAAQPSQHSPDFVPQSKPVNAPPMNLQPETTDFEFSQFCDCCSNKVICCWSLCIPVALWDLTVGTNHEGEDLNELGMKKYCFNPFCLCFLIHFFIFIPIIWPATLAALSKMLPKNEPYSNCCWALLCPCLRISQIYREIGKRGRHTSCCCSGRCL